MVLDLARPSEPWCFAAGSCFFRSCFTGISSSSRRHQFCEQPQATESFDLARPSEPWCFAAGGCFFRSCFTGISSSSRRQQNLSTNAVFLDFLDFSRFPDDTLGSFFRVVLDLARPSEPWCFAAGSCFFFLRVAAGNRISRQMLFFYRIFYRISDDRLGNFLAWFWNLLVFQSHSVLLRGTAFFEAG